MPAEFYSFRPVPEIETFAQRVAHIAGADLGACTGVLTNTARPLAPAAGATKTELVAALKHAFAACDKAFDATTDKNAFDQVSARLGGPFPPGVSTRTRLFTLSTWCATLMRSRIYVRLSSAEGYCSALQRSRIGRGYANLKIRTQFQKQLTTRLQLFYEQK